MLEVLKFKQDYLSTIVLQERVEQIYYLLPWAKERSKMKVNPKKREVTCFNLMMLMQGPTQTDSKKKFHPNFLEK